MVKYHLSLRRHRDSLCFTARCALQTDTNIDIYALSANLCCFTEKKKHVDYFSVD